jgi:hypothetical protein
MYKMTGKFNQILFKYGFLLENYSPKKIHNLTYLANFFVKKNMYKMLREFRIIHICE